MNCEDLLLDIYVNNTGGDYEDLYIKFIVEIHYHFWTNNAWIGKIIKEFLEKIFSYDINMKLLKLIARYFKGFYSQDEDKNYYNSVNNGITEEKKSCNSVNNGITEEKGDFSPGKYSYFRESLTITFAEKIKGYQDRYGGCEESFYILNSLLEQNDFFAYNIDDVVTFIREKRFDEYIFLHFLYAIKNDYLSIPTNLLDEIIIYTKDSDFKSAKIYQIAVYISNKDQIVKENIKSRINDYVSIFSKIINSNDFDLQISITEILNEYIDSISCSERKENILKQLFIQKLKGKINENIFNVSMILEKILKENPRINLISEIFQDNGENILEYLYLDKIVKQLLKSQIENINEMHELTRISGFIWNFIRESTYNIEDKHLECSFWLLKKIAYYDPQRFYNSEELLGFLYGNLV